MISLYNKYRPDCFEDIVGNEGTVSSLRGVMGKKNRPHAFLFVGNPGTGKTTLARIMSRELGANEHSTIEVNSANNRGIETARELLNGLSCRPLFSDVQVFILDEFHRATKDFQSAMLKAIEEPPDFVYFFLCTTDIKKVDKAIISRCTDYKLQDLKPKQLVSVIRRVNREEGLGLDPELMLEIAENSEGSSRNALVMAEKLSLVTDPDERFNLVRSGMADTDPETIELCRVILTARVWSDISKVVKKYKGDPEACRMAVLGYAQAILLSGKRSPRAGLVLEYFREPFWNCGKPGLTLACYQAFELSQ